VVVSLDAGRLEEISDAAGGDYRSAGDDPRTLATLYDDRIVERGREALVVADGGALENRYQWPLLLALVLWILDLCVNLRRR
jgi:hypothetical protein